MGFVPRSAPRWLTDPIVHVLARAGVTPNMLTAAGLVGNVGAAVLAAYGEFLPAGLIVLAASSLDVLDGALARATNRATDFGSVFDSVIDRVSEAAVLFGLVIYFSDQPGTTEEMLAFAAVTGSILISYIRARAEIIGLKMKEGLFTRLERVLLIGVVLTIGRATTLLWILAIAANVTAVQRLILVWWRTREDGNRTSENENR